LEGHAAVNAIKNIKPEDLSLPEQATIYVSLEPCFHFGKTPTCVDLILKHTISRVVIRVTDKKRKVGGKRIQKLRENEVEVITAVLETEGEEIIKNFLNRFEV